MKNIFKRTILLFLSLLMVMGTQGGTSVYAAAAVSSSNKDSSAPDKANVSNQTSAIKVTSVSLGNTVLELDLNKTIELSAKVMPSTATDKTLEWSSDNTSIAKVDSNGKITSISVGTAIITAKAKDGSGKYSTCKVTVIDASKIKVKSLSLNVGNTTMNLNATRQLEARISPSNAANKEVEWTSNDTSILKVDKNGLVTAVGAGNASITATTKDGSNLSVKCTVKVVDTSKVTSVSLNAYQMSMNLNETKELTATVKPVNAADKSLEWSSDNTSVAKVDANGKVTAVGVGTATIKAKAKDGSEKYSTCRVSVIDASKISVTGIRLNSTSIRMNLNTTRDLIATLTPSTVGKRALDWKSDNTSVAKVDADGKVTAVGEGSAKITATVKDGSNKSATCTITVIDSEKITSITLNTTSVEMYISDTQIITARILPVNAANKNLDWSSDNTAVAKVDAAGKISAVGEGTAVITAKAKDGSGKYSICKVTVIDASKIKIKSLSLNVGNATMNLNTTRQLTAIINPSNAANKEIEWTSSDTSILKVDKNGLVTAVGAGNASITAATKDGSNLSVKCTVKVVDTSKVTSVSLNAYQMSMNLSETKELTATVKPVNAADKSLEWTSDNTSVAKVDANGKVTAVGVGTATIKAKAKDGSEKYSTCRVSVIDASKISVTGIRLNSTSIRMNLNTTKDLIATLTPSIVGKRALDWSSDNTAVVKVDADGKVTAVGVGTAKITVTVKDGSNKSATCTITVVDLSKITSVTLSTNALQMSLSDTQVITAKILPVDAADKNLDWSSDNTSVVKVDANGKVTAIGEGTAVITAKAKDGSNKYSTCKVTVIDASKIKVKSLSLNVGNTTMNLNATRQLEARISPSNAANKEVEWTSNDTSILKVDKNGLVTAVGAGNASITATTKDGSNLSVKCTVTVIDPLKVKTVSISPATVRLTQGSSKVLSASITPVNAKNKSLAWSSSNTSIVKVDANGKVTAVAKGSAKITATAKDGSGKYGTCTVTVS